MAMMACLAKLLTSSICFSVNRPVFPTKNIEGTNRLIVLDEWYGELRPVPGLNDTNTGRLAVKVHLIVNEVRDLNDLFQSDAAANTTGWSWAKEWFAFRLFEQSCWRVVSCHYSNISSFTQA